LQNQRRKGEEEGSSGLTELAMSMEKLQSGTDDELWAMRKYCSDLQSEKLSLTQESDALRRERDELKADFDELKIKYSAFKEHLNTILEEHDVILEDKAKLVHDGGIEMMLDELSSILKTHLIVIRERDTLKSEHEEMKVDFDEFKTEYNAQKHNLNAITEERDALQRDRNNLLGPEGTVEIMLEDLSGIQEAQLKLTQERDTLRSKHDELEVNFEDLARECNALKDNLSIIREKCDALHRDKDALLRLGATMKMLDESSIQNPKFLLTQEGDTMRSEHDKLKVNSGKLARETNAQKDNLNVISEKCDSLQREEDVLLGVEATVKMMLDEKSRIQNPHFVLTHVMDTLRSEYKEVKADFDRLKQECSTLKNYLNAIREERSALQKEKNMLVGLEGEIKMMLDELSSTKKADLVVTQERDALRSEYNELKVELDKYKRECSALRKDLNAIREEHDACQREKEKLVGMACGRKIMPNEKLSVKRTRQIVSRERATLRSGREELKVNSDELKRIYNDLNKM
jgi:chromosome segregation ATPase